MLPQSRSSSRRRAFFNLAASKCHVLYLPEASHRRRHSGSSHGWLVMLDEYPPIFLVNPLTRAKIDLPPLSTFPYVVGFDVFNVGREYVLQSSDDDSHVNYVSRFYTCGLKEMRDSFVKKIVLSNSPSGGSKFLALAIITVKVACEVAGGSNVVKSTQKQGNLQAGLPVVCKHLGKSRSASMKQELSDSWNLQELCPFCLEHADKNAL